MSPNSQGGAGDAAGKQRRANHRVDFVRAATAITVHHPGGSITNCLVSTQDISAGGMSFVYGNFLHVGTMVVITLRRHRGGEEKVVGTVTRCSYLSASRHDIGVKFKKPIFPQLFVDPMQWDELAEPSAVKPEDLTGDVLLLDDQEMDRDLFEHLLRGTKLQLTAVGTLQEAIAAVKTKQFGAACIDVNLGIGQPSGELAGKSLRGAGFKGKFIVSSIESTARASASKSLGTALSLQKPFDRTQLLYSIAMAMQIQGDEQSDPIYSTMEDRASSKALLERYISHAKRVSIELHELIEKKDFAAVRTQCQSMRGTAGGYGFEPLADAAAKAVTALDAGTNVQEAEAELQVLQTICRRLSAEGPA
jgi:CheY-like chemotaxis protein